MGPCLSRARLPRALRRTWYPHHTFRNTNGRFTMKTKLQTIIGSLALIGALSISAASAFAQDRLTVDQFFKKLSAHYAEIKDYEASVSIKTSKGLMAGTIAYKAPTQMRLDFTQPKGQTILYNGDTLIVYVPDLNATLSQKTSTTSGASAASGDGLKMLGRSYSPAYEKTPDPVPLPGSETELVVRIVLSRNAVAEGFRTIILSVNPQTLLIRRMEGLTIGGESIVYDFTDIRLNQGLADTRFLYDPPASANQYNNFLFSPEM